MIFILHYVLFNVGLPAIILLITLFIDTHSDASLSEIGALLMALPFVSIFTKPLVCALADRKRAHRQILMASLALMALGYGSLVIAPCFFPDFVRRHGRLVWYLDIAGIVVGYGAFGIVWSLGDALAINGAQMAGVSWGSYRLWSVVSWGVCGALIGQVNEVNFLPVYVPGLLLLVAALAVEIGLLAVWPRERFVICDHSNYSAAGDALPAQIEQMGFDEHYWRPANKSLTGTTTSSFVGGSLNAQSKVLARDAGDSSTKMGTETSRQSRFARKSLNEFFGEDLEADRRSTQTDFCLSAAEKPHWQQIHLEPATAHREKQQVAHELGLGKQAQVDAADIQLFLLKLILKRDKTLAKYLALFTLIGLVMMCHISYFFMHVRQLCAKRGEDFATISGAMMLAPAVSEVSSFLIAPRYLPWAGRAGTLLTCAALYLVRFAYYGLWLEQLPTYFGVPFECCHGLAYGIVYSLVCDVAIGCVDQLDEYLPELKERGFVSANIRASELKSPLRATMQGVLSGAFDGLGNGLGALFGGVFLDFYPFERLWQVCAGVCLAIIVIYPLTELGLARGAQRGSERSARLAR